jgi:hypothetical protein
VRGDSSSIYIRPDGSVDSHSTPIQRIGDRYTFMGNISGFIIKLCAIHARFNVAAGESASRLESETPIKRRKSTQLVHIYH